MDKKFDRENVGAYRLKTVLLAAAASIVCVILGAMLITTFLISGSVSLERMDLTTCVALVLSLLIGSFWIKIRIGEGSGSTILIYVAAMVFLLVINNIVFLGAQFRLVIAKLAAVVLGSAPVIFVGNDKRKRLKKRRKR